MTDTAIATPLDEIVASYLTMRNTMQEKEEVHKTEMADLKLVFDKLSQQLLEVCNAQNADSIRTHAGTVSRRVTSRYWTSDWDTMYNFINDNAAPFLLEQRIHNGNMKQFLQENPDRFPAGLQADNKYTIQVRRPTNT